MLAMRQTTRRVQMSEREKAMNNHTPIITLHPKPSRPVERIPNGTRVAVCIEPCAGERAALKGVITGCKFTVPLRYDVEPDDPGIERLIGVLRERIELLNDEIA